MPKPRVFVSSTFYDLESVRDDLHSFIKAQGFEPVLHDRGHIPYGKGKKPEEYAYDEAGLCDILVCVVGGRSGSVSGDGEASITRRELTSAFARGRQIYVFVHDPVHHEHRNYVANKDVPNVKFPAVDDVRVHKFLEVVYRQGNPTFPFSVASDITSILRDQWAGLFHRLLNPIGKSDAFIVYSPPGFAEDLMAHLMRTGRPDWGQRALYIGVDGARSWLAVSEHPDYAIDERKLKDALLQIVNGIGGRIGCLVSLGPGDGKVDIWLMSRLAAAKGNGTSYVPVDISEGLLMVTMKRFRGAHRDVRMPFGILGDFEYGWDHFRPMLDGEGKPRLYSILGNTVSNVDVGLEDFFPKLWAGVATGDYVLFDVLLGDFDELLGSSESGSFDPNILFPDSDEAMRHYKEFIGHGARRVTMDHRVFDENACCLSDSLAIRRSKEVGFDQMHLQYRGDRGERRSIFKWRRYESDTSKLLEFLRSNLQGCSVVATSDVTDDGKTTRLILLQRT